MREHRPVRIAIDAASARSGGGTIRVRELARTMPVLRPHHRYLFVVRRELEAAVRNIAPDIETLCPPRAFDRPPARLAWQQLRLPGFLRDWQPDIVFAPFGVLPLRWGEPRPVLAMIVSNLAPYSPELRRLYRGPGRVRLDILRNLTDRSVAIADRVFLLSNQAFDLIDHPELPGRAEVIPMAPPPVISIEPTTNAPKEPYFVLVADILRYKGIEAAVSALALLDNSTRPLVLVCGSLLDRSYLRLLVRKAEDLGVAERLRFMGPTDHRMVLSLLGTSAGCIVPSRFENKTRVPYEAMAVGAPLLLNDLPTFRESAGDACLYFDVDRPEQLARHMGTLIENVETRRRLSEAGRARVASIKITDASEHILDSLERLIGARLASRTAGADMNRSLAR
jgi:glycosyltransferase involved in cell wall biosynthesis